MDIDESGLEKITINDAREAAAKLTDIFVKNSVIREQGNPEGIPINEGTKELLRLALTEELFAYTKTNSLFKDKNGAYLIKKSNGSYSYIESDRRFFRSLKGLGISQR